MLNSGIESDFCSLPPKTKVCIERPRAHCHAFRKGFVTALLQAGNPITSVSRMVHHHCSAVTERCYDKRTFDEIVKGMVLPVEWSTGLNVPIDQEHERAAYALLEEMERNERLSDQLRAALALLTPEQRHRFAGDHGVTAPHEGDCDPGPLPPATQALHRCPSATESACQPQCSPLSRGGKTAP